MAKVVRKIFLNPGGLECIQTSGSFKSALYCPCVDNEEMESGEWILSDSIVELVRSYYRRYDIASMNFEYVEDKYECIDTDGDLKFEDEVTGFWVLEKDITSLPLEVLPWCDCEEKTPSKELSSEEVMVEFYYSFLMTIGLHSCCVFYGQPSLCQFFHESLDFQSYIQDWKNSVELTAV